MKKEEKVDSSIQENEAHNDLIIKLEDSFMAYMAPKLLNNDLAKLSMTNRFFRDVSQVELKRKTLNELTQRMAWGNQAGAEKILLCRPELLLAKDGVAPDVFNRPGMDIKRGLTPFQVALGVGDVEMCEMMKRYFEKLPNGLEAMQNQFNEIFPEGYEAHIEEQKKNAFDFSDIIQTIIAATDDNVKTCLKTPNNDTPLGQAFSAFRDQFTQKSQSEKIFNPYHLLRALETYRDQLNAFSTWDKQDLFCIQVIGFTQRFLPACYAQAFARGFDDLVENKKPLQRSFEFKYCFDWIKKDFSVSPVSSDDWLGFKEVAWGGWRGVGADAVRARRSGALFKNLCQTKITGFQNLCDRSSARRFAVH